MPTLEFFYDIGSPYSYLAATRVEAIAAGTGSALFWRPMLLGGVFKATGNEPPAMLAARASYMLTDLKRWAKHYGVPFEFPQQFPLNTLLTMRALTALPDDELSDATRALFRAYWAEGRDVSSPEVLEALLGEGLVGQAQDQQVKDRLRSTTEEAVDRGAFGAPTFFVGEQMFFGNDRLPFVEGALRQAE